MSKTIQSPQERITSKYDGLTTLWWHDNGDISLIPGGKETLVDLYDKLPAVWNDCRKVGLTNEGYVAWKNPKGDIVFTGITVMPHNVDVNCKTWWVERTRKQKQYKDHPVGSGWYISPE